MQSTPRRLECAEIWSGNQETTSLAELPGLEAWVYSVPLGSDHGGGDVHYLSVCPSCIVSRIALADVSGHGETVARLGEKLSELMERYLRDLEQVALMRDLNHALREDFDDGHYATMVAIGWHGRRGLMVMTNAGHPPPLLYRAARDEWTWLETLRPADRGRVSGVPLGLLPDVTYDRVVLRPQSDDVVVLYSDGISEALNAAGAELGRDGLMELLRAVDVRSPEVLGTRLLSALRAFRGDAALQDDQTIIVLRRTGS
jgi:sigma-B regulation protein RsbU (phosphoserine phosphatase)